MPSTLTWLDHDAEARERTLRILALFQERESRDELGLGAIRDSIGDLLFPGTSTLHTRLRYMLFVPWIYRRLEERALEAPKFGQEADRLERALVDPLVKADDNAGVFGRTAGQRLKRLPSSVYWAGLGTWGIRLTPHSRDEYHRRIGETYERRRRLTDQMKRNREREDDSDLAGARGIDNWHPRLPEPPAGFPTAADLALTSEEASFIRDRIQAECHGSLLAHLARLSGPAECDFPWQHPARGDFAPDHVELLDHAERFSDLMHGAAISYNYQLARRRGAEDTMQERQQDFDTWATVQRPEALNAWSLQRLWNLTAGTTHTISPRTKEFVERWKALVTESPESLLTSERALKLVEGRERSLKGTRSRFTNRRALEQWGGSSGLRRLSYRWPNVQGLLRDLYDGLNR